MLSIFFIVVFLANLITPIPSGVIYTIFGALPVLGIALILNLVILAFLLMANVEPKQIPDEYSQM
jgi:hypothetical protein